MSVRGFKLQAKEQAALDAARARFVSWYAGLPRHNPKTLAALRDAARAFHDAAQPFLNSHMNPTAQTLLVRMQEIELSQHPKGRYEDILTMAGYTTGLIVRATAVDVTPGRPRDERAWAWVCMAADAWDAAGAGEPTSTGRFAQALHDFNQDDLPPVSGKDQIAAALKHWRGIVKRVTPP